MARPSDIDSKPIATRVPMSDYIKFLQEASERKLSMSEFLLLKIYGESPQILNKGGNLAETDALKKENEALKLSLKATEENRDKWKKDWTSRKAKYDELEKRFNSAQEELKESKKRIAELEAEVKETNDLWEAIETVDSLSFVIYKEGNWDRGSEYGLLHTKLCKARLAHREKTGENNIPVSEMLKKKQ